MDDSLRALQRATAGDPSDPALAQRFEQALRRAEEGELLLERYRFKFACPLRFEDLNPTSDARVRACARCERPVRLATTASELASVVAGGGCAAFPRAWGDQGFAQLVDEPALDSAQDSKAPCAVPSEVSWLDLSPQSPARAEISPGLGGLFAGELLVTGPALPLRVEDGAVHLAVASLELSESLLQHVCLASGARQVRLFLADREQIHELLEVHAPPQPLMMGMLIEEPAPGPQSEDLGPRLA